MLSSYLIFTAKRKKKGNGIEVFYAIKAGEDEESGILSWRSTKQIKCYLPSIRVLDCYSFGAKIDSSIGS